MVFAVPSLTVLFGKIICENPCPKIDLIWFSPVDVVKTRIQLDPVKYNRGLIGGFSQVVAEEGMAGLATGLGPTVVGYFIQGKSILPSLLLVLHVVYRMVQVRWC